MSSERNIIMDPGLALHLPMHELDGNSFMSKDAYGHLCTATGVLWRPDGRSFDGVDDYINANDPLSAVGGSTRKTLIARANPGKTNFSTIGRIISLQRLAAGTAFAIYASGNPATWRASYIVGSTTFSELNSGISLVAGQTVFLAHTQDGDSIRFQVNDTVVTASNAGTPAISNPANAFIGAFEENGTPKQFFSGIISEAYIFSRALTPLEVEQIRLATKWRYR